MLALAAGMAVSPPVFAAAPDDAGQAGTVLLIPELSKLASLPQGPVFGADPYDIHDSSGAAPPQACSGGEDNLLGQMRCGNAILNKINEQIMAVSALRDDLPVNDRDILDGATNLLSSAPPSCATALNSYRSALILVTGLDIERINDLQVAKDPASAPAVPGIYKELRVASTDLGACFKTVSQTLHSSSPVAAASLALTSQGFQNAMQDLSLKMD